MSQGEHKEESFLEKYIFSQDHKVIGIQYGITSLIFLLIGFLLMAVMRYQLAYPDTPVPFAANLEEAYIPNTDKVLDVASELIDDLKQAKS